MTDTATPTRGTTLAQDLRDALQRMIVEGDLTPGERLDETVLAKRFSVSRTPVREALKALVATGLAEVKPRQGTTVSTLSIPTLIEMFELMSALEGLCARLAARRATGEETHAMHAVHARLIEAYERNDPEAFYAINAEFHDLLYAAAHTHFLAGQTIALRLRLAPYRRKVTYLPGRMRDTLKEHATILAAIEDGNSERAQQAASEHVRLLGDHLSDFISTIPPELLT
ncbi:GntR family transcriptional regulator [Sinirhodobacter populi]|uniref:GntR family transcriptional regulator n=1 Tax=Paenirhodobacter populi TaxID=2306993 RepID=A0A443KAN8_9RHOB|nr:GntR family transcriptional regulator [Sinirhodobacter populi]RWR29879.1 GntR family transcriptional regulator [Sinirhodobacter populi]